MNQLYTIYILLLTGSLCLKAENIENFLDRESLGGNLFGFRDVLHESGIQLLMGYDAEIWSNASGGITTGTKLMGLGTVQTEYDLEIIAGLKGSKITADGIWYYGTQPTELLIGADSSTNISGIEAESNFWRFYQLYWQQEMGEALTFRIGQLAADETFMISEYAGLFINAQFGALPSMAENVNAPIYPLPGPGAYAAWESAGSPWFGRIGLYTADAGQDISSNIGFDWQLGGGVGGTLFIEAGRHCETFGLPGTVTLGFVGANSEIPDYRTGLNERGFYSIYLMADQALLLGDEGETRLAAFTRFAYNPQSTRSVQHYYWDAGLNIPRPFSNRPDDAAGIAFGYERYYGYYRSASAASGQPVTQGQTVVEVTYQASISRWLTVQPDFQMFFDPEFSDNDAYVVGIRASIVF